MKKSVAFLTALTMVLCLVFAGCGQNADKQSADNGQYSAVDNKSGKYIYIVRGHEVELSVNIGDYINSDDKDNLFDLASLAEHYGYNEKYSLDGLYMNRYDDGTLVFAGFQHDESDDTTQIKIGCETGLVTSVAYSDYNSKKMDYVYEEAHYPVSFEFIILCAYAMEYNSSSIQDDTFSTILEDYQSDNASYVLSKPKK